MIKRWFATMGIHDIDDVAADGVAVLMILLLAVVLHLTLGRGLRAAILRFAGNTTTTWDDLLVEHKVVQRLLLLLPTAVIWFGVRALPDVNHTLEVVVERAAEALVTILVARVLDALLRHQGLA